MSATIYAFPQRGCAPRQMEQLQPSGQSSAIDELTESLMGIGGDVGRACRALSEIKKMISAAQTTQEVGES